MPKLLIAAVVLLILQSCSKKKERLAVNDDGFPSGSNALPGTLTGKWIRTDRLQTFDYKPNEWVEETADPSAKKFLQLNADKTYSSNQIECSNCKTEFLNDTLYVRHSTGYYKFPVLLLNDSLLYLKTHIDDPAYSLPNTGLFDFVLEEKYRKAK